MCAASLVFIAGSILPLDFSLAVGSLQHLNCMGPADSRPATRSQPTTRPWASSLFKASLTCSRLTPIASARLPVVSGSRSSSCRSFFCTGPSLNFFRALIPLNQLNLTKPRMNVPLEISFIRYPRDESGEGSYPIPSRRIKPEESSHTINSPAGLSAAPMMRGWGP